MSGFGLTHCPKMNMANLVPLQEELEALKFFGKPKLALDAVGGSSAARMADALQEVRSR